MINEESKKCPECGHVSRKWPNAIIVLRALMDVGRVEMGGRQYCFDQDYRLCQIGWNQDGDEGLMVVNMGEGISLSMFIQWCDSLSDDDIAFIGLNHALNKLNPFPNED